MYQITFIGLVGNINLYWAQMRQISGANLLKEQNIRSEIELKLFTAGLLKVIL